MRVLVTGGSGFIGSNVARKLIQQRHEVFITVRPHSDLRRVQGICSEIEIVEGDLLDAPRILKTVKHIRPEMIAHLAWYTEPGKYLHAARENRIALQAGVNLLQAAATVKGSRVILAGTFLESLEGSPASSYAEAKQALHSTAESLASEGLEAVCAHIHYLFGPWEHEGRLTPHVVRSLIKGQPVSVTSGEQKLDYLHVFDVASAICVLGESDFRGTVDICSGEAVPLWKIFAAIENAVGRRGLVRLGAVPLKDGDILFARGDPEKLRSMGWAPSFTLESGIAQTVNWWREYEEAKKSG